MKPQLVSIAICGLTALFPMRCGAQEGPEQDPAEKKPPTMAGADQGRARALRNNPARTQVFRATAADPRTAR
jgi:hypothetical protein